MVASSESKVVEAAFSVNGFSFAGRSQSQGMLFVRLRDWSVREDPELKVQALMQRLARHFASSQQAMVVPVNPPPIQDLGPVNRDQHGRVAVLRDADGG